MLSATIQPKIWYIKQRNRQIVHFKTQNWFPMVEKWDI